MTCCNCTRLAVRAGRPSARRALVRLARAAAVMTWLSLVIGVGAATVMSKVGAYAINQGSISASSNYALTYIGANLAVTPRALTIVRPLLAAR